ncbi:error-prone DNA polymerase [Comamonadaceae bacterium OTU4NAUVB1]|nr:error-prone DNA polymerase [Comamonadaceae bacterium OTU4NAUVB1]
MPDLTDRQLRARQRARLRVVPDPGADAAAAADAEAPDYAELHCLTHFSFQRGVSSPAELATRAWQLDFRALAITDECSVAGIVRAHVGLRDHLHALDEWEREHPDEPRAWRNADFRLLYGSEFRFERFTLVAIAHDMAGWGHLCEFITAARTTEAPKGAYRVRWDATAAEEGEEGGGPARRAGGVGSGGAADPASLRHCEILLVPARAPGREVDAAVLRADLAVARGLYGEHLWLAVELFDEVDDDLWLMALESAGAATGVPRVAAGDIHMHVRGRKPLQDVVTAIGLGRGVAACGLALQSNAERHLRARGRLRDLYPDELLANTLRVARRCRFDPDRLRDHYQYPRELLGSGETPARTLVRKTWEGALRRYPLARHANGIPEGVCRQVRRELDLIVELGYEMFFLTVEDIVAFARARGILCQGRGSSANSAVCYCLGITAIDPDRGHLLFERFLSRERREPPDIDVDFEHQRREEVIQYIYAQYGRDRAAIAAVVIRYRPRSALRDVGRAMDVDARLVDDFARDHHGFDATVLEERIEAAMARTGVREGPAKLRQWLALARQLEDTPRHLSQHVGGFVLTQTKLTRLVPVEKASMKDRSVIQWEKDDLEAMGMLKVDVLALGMLSAIRRALDFANAWRGTALAMHQIPDDDPAVYDMICRADTVGVFQVESRAQMSMLPRLRPRCYYDLVIEVAIVRPGPIQGGMVHPYLRNRERVRRGLPLDDPYPALAPALARTLGVPIFQEQVMQIAMIAAGFSPERADRLRRAMAAWKRAGGVDVFQHELVEGMVARGYARDFAVSVFRQIEGFGEYGFPESHAASFALLVSASCWLKHHEPACFLAALLDAQPMGFYSASQLVQDARRHGVEVRPVDVAVSGMDCTLEPAAEPGAHDHPAVRLGLRRVASLSEAGALRLLAARADAPFADTEDLALRAALDGVDLAALAAADALAALSGHRRQQVWDATAHRRPPPGLLAGVPIHETALALPPAPEGEEIVGDYAALGLTLRRHPLALLRPRMARLKLLSAEELDRLPHGHRVRACGIVTMRQRPQTAHGTMFVSLEDETGIVNVIVWKDVAEAQREPLLRAKLLAVQGVWQRDVDTGGRVRHLLARGFRDLTPWLGRLAEGRRSRDFH